MSVLVSARLLSTRSFLVMSILLTALWLCQYMGLAADSTVEISSFAMKSSSFVAASDLQ